jgi:hypothetical protein
MKITPIAGAGMGAIQTNTSGSSSMKEAAKQAYLGQTPTRIAESDTPVSDAIQTVARDIKRIKMRTQRSPDRIEEMPAEVAPAQAPVADAASATLDPNVQAIQPEVTRPISPQLAEVAKQRRAVQVREQQLLAKEEALKAQYADAIELAKLKAEPLSVLKQAGVTYDDLTQALLSDQSGPSQEILALKAEIESLKKGIDTKFQTQEQAQEEAVLREILFEAEGLAKEGDNYELIRGEDGYEKVLRKIYNTYKKTGRVLDTHEAMNEVEKELRAQTDRYLNYGYVKSKLAQSQPVPQTRNQTMRTLTNRDTATQPMSMRARAIAAAEGRLKK